MRKVTDILLAEEMDLQIDNNGEFICGDSSAQHQKLLLLIQKGECKESPTRGVGVRRYLETHSTQELAREIRQEFSIDGMLVDYISISSNKNIDIEADYV